MRRSFAWGIVDQGFSSATNLVVSLVAARLLGPYGLGVFAIGFSAYLLSVNFLRTFLSEPAIIGSTTIAPQERALAARAALTMAVALGLAASAFFALVGLALPGAIGRGLLLFSPWLAPALVNELCRSVLFRDGRGRGAALNEASWFLATAAAIPLAVAADAVWAVVAAWGIGASTAAVLGLAQLRLRPLRPQAALTWWRRHVWPLGRWLATAGLIFAASGQGVTLIFAALLGPSAVGGLRAAQTIFAPLTLLGTAATLPGLPALARSLQHSLSAARWLAAKTSGMLVVMTLVYLLLVGAARGQLLAFLFGERFRHYDWLIAPVGGQQLLLAAGLGFVLLLKANRQGLDLVWVRLVASAATLGLGTVLAWHDGLAGGVWGLAAGTAVGSAMLACYALWPTRSRAWLAPRLVRSAG